LGKWQWDRANKEPRLAIQMPLRAFYSIVSNVASEMLLRAIMLAGGFCAIPLCMGAAWHTCTRLISVSEM